MKQTGVCLQTDAVSSMKRLDRHCAALLETDEPVEAQISLSLSSSLFGAADSRFKRFHVQ